MMTNQPLSATITNIRQLTADTTLYTLRRSDKAYGPEISHGVDRFLPGQFLELSLPGVGEAPISYCGHPAGDGSIELCIRHIGHVTAPLKNAVPGDIVGLRGPFGCGFPLSCYENQDLLLIAGGLGMAPLRSLILSLLRQREKWGLLTLLYGARDRAALLFLDELSEMAAQGDILIHLGIDRPGRCEVIPPNCRIAMLPALLDNIEISPERTYSVLCGPPAVYPILVEKLKQMELADDRIHLSLERRMKCGLGRCCHCAVGTLLCCTDGPVFSLEQLKGIEGALV